jgi:hypothetical protein
MSRTISVCIISFFSYNNIMFSYHQSPYTNYEAQKIIHLQGQNVFVAGVVIEASEMIEPPHLPDN